MTRALTTSLRDATLAEHVAVMLLLDLDFVSGHLRLCTASCDFTWDTYTWTGAAHVLGVSWIQEPSSMYVAGVEMVLSGIPTDIVSKVRTEAFQGRACDIYLAALDSSYAIIANPHKIFAGRMDTAAFDVGQESRIMLTAESRLVYGNRAQVRRYNDADQQARFPGDLGCQYVEALSNKALVWQAASPVGQPAGSSPHAGSGYGPGYTAGGGSRPASPSYGPGFTSGATAAPTYDAAAALRAGGGR